ncbi:hypothetical protein KS4_11010 [Poriferisphaera corsica]|uniref:Uncharacterized protein n=1 Tax=Poriferisphaera corsica TaxID=2528020 RepID=A0A517YS60_9BACT|nr:endonuclease NucS domain-containing protein [Poriferisphaera corsica]QDU33060.1 hypothetical protein KS4_11010 [Poriferisphaera corsica]
MGDVKLFRINGESAIEVEGGAVKLEKQLQVIVERHLKLLLQIRLVASEYSTGKTHAGRIDTLGLDEDNCPVIIEYKRNANANVINQGLFYLDWLMDHQAEFEMLVLRQFGQDAADQIDWSSPRLLCIAEDFSRYDVHAVQQINKNIELLRYAYYPNDDLLMLELVNAVVAKSESRTKVNETSSSQVAKVQYTTQVEYLEKASPELKNLYEAVQDYMISLGDGVQERFLKLYIAFKRMRNFASIKLMTQNNSILMYLPLSPDDFELEEGFTRDVRNIGHHGTGHFELTIRNLEDLDKAKFYIQLSYEGHPSSSQIAKV